MALSNQVVGVTAPPVRVDVDARWLMAYAAGLGLADPGWYDTTAARGPVAHPVFTAAPEWVLQTGFRPTDGLLAPGERTRTVHYGQDVLHHRRLRAGDVAVVSGTVASVDRHRAGTLLTVRLDGHVDDEPAWTTWNTGLLRGVELTGAPWALDAPPPLPTIAPGARPVVTSVVEVRAEAAHTYTECARIWNPVHTDVARARAAGLPGLILHGTATLALGVTHALGLAGRPETAPVRRVRARFGAMVPMPTELTVRLLEVDGDRLHFDVHDPTGAPVVREGLLVCADDPDSKET